MRSAAVTFQAEGIASRSATPAKDRGDIVSILRGQRDGRDRRIRGQVRAIGCSDDDRGNGRLIEDMTAAIEDITTHG